MVNRLLSASDIDRNAVYDLSSRCLYRLTESGIW